MTKTTLQERFEELTWEEDLENLAEGLDIGGYYCCDGRECCCNAESKISVLKRFIKGYIEQEKQLSVREERERIMEILHERKREYHKDCLTDMFINGRFWEAQDVWEILQKESKGISLITQTK